MLLKLLSGVAFLFLLDITDSSAIDSDPIVSLPTGKIRGHVLKSEKGDDYYSFQEIPYAAPPVGDRRFKEPIAPESWDGILDTKANTKICYQQNASQPTANVTETEDCLYINVYTPQLPTESSTNLLPVFVWIHGGGFVYGDGTFQQIGPKFFIDYGIVIVAMNYRLGPLGFLTTEDGVIPGNLGLKDQNFALQWVKNNIQLFGGDPEKITIAGESAGGGSVGYQLVSKMSKDLFRGVILQSGTSISPWARQPYAKQIAFILGKAIDTSFSSDDSADLLNLLMNASAADITYTVLPELPSDINTYGQTWAPIVEDEKLEGAFVTGPMHDDIKSGNINQVPIIIGFNSEEYLSFVLGGTDSIMQQGAYFDDDLSRVVEHVFNMTDADKETVGSELRKIYTNGSFHDDAATMVRYKSDADFATPSIRHAEIQSEYTDVYLYQMSYKGKLGQLVNFTVTVEGIDPGLVGHAEDLKYLWDDSQNSDASQYPEEDILTRQRIHTLWSNFVKYQNPIPEDDDLLQNVKWPKVSSDDIVYLNINSTLEVKTDPKQYKKWKEIVDKSVLPPIVVY